MLLDASSPLGSALMQLRNDAATSAVALVQVMQSSPTNTPTAASVPSEVSKTWSVLASDWNTTWQAFVQVEYAMLGVIQREFDTLLGIQVPGPSSSPPQPAPNSPVSSPAFSPPPPLSPPHAAPPITRGTAGTEPNPNDPGRVEMPFSSPNPLAWQGGPTFSWTGTLPGGPIVNTLYPQTNTEGDNVSLQVQANGGQLVYDAVGLPPGLSIDSSSGLISGTVAYGAAEDFGGSYNPTVIVSDFQGGSTQKSFSWTINQAQIAPTIDPPNQTNLRGDTVSLQVNASQVDNDPLTYTATNLPPGLSIDAGTGLISGTVDPSATLAVPYAVTVTATDDVTNLSANQTFNWTIQASNVAPVLTSPGNQTNAAGDDVSLQLSATDADGDNLSYTASGLPPGLTLDPIAGTITGTLPNSAASSTPYNVSATASDGSASNSQSFTWTVNGVSLQNPGDQSNLDGDSVSLQLTASDANNNTLTYSATGLPSGLSINSTTGLLSGTISNTDDTSSPYSVTVTAKDSANNSASQTFNWTVARLSLNTLSNQENREGTAVSLQASAIDHVGTPTYSATGLPPGLSINSTTGLISGTVGIGSFSSSPYQVTVTATDSSHTSSQSFVWTVTPRVALVNPGPQSNATGDSVSLQLSATSPGGTMSYSASGLPSGLSINSGTGLISGTLPSTDASSTPYTVTVTANDGTSHSSQIFAWTISAINLVSPGDQSNNDGDAVSLSLTTGYHGSGTLSYSATGLPTGLSINGSTGKISGTISGTADTNSPYSVTVTATAGTNTASQTFNWTVNAVVSISSISDQDNADGDAVSLQVSASDSLNKTLTYSATHLPSGLSIASATGLISGTISAGADANSPYAVTVTATDSAGNSATQTFNWTVTKVGLVNPGSQASVDGQAVSLQLQGSSGATYSATGLPTNVSINSSTGLISGTLASNADTSSPYVVTATATLGTNNISQTFVWTVTPTGLAAVSAQTNTEGDSVSLQVPGLSGGGSLTYSASGLPGGLSLNSTTGLITGTVSAGDAANGPYTVDVSVTNGTVSASQTFTWNINPVVNLTAPADQSNNEGDIVSLQISATDSLHNTLTYSADGLPAGLSINSTTGLISGTISSGDAANGIYAGTVTASDGTYSSSVTFNWNITHSDTTALTMTNPGTQTNVAGDNINLQVNASDPDGIDTLTYSATGLPDGITIDQYSGLISGTLADDAVSNTPYQVTLTAGDGNGQAVSQTFTWLVNAPVIVDLPSPVSAIEGQNTGSITVATFTTPDLNSQASDFMAAINWGDGNSGLGTVSGGNGSFTVTADHSYTGKSSDTVTIIVTDTITGYSTTDSTTATVTDAPLTLTAGFELGAIQQQSSTLTLATFTDGNLNAPLSDFTATINWGDGSGNQAATVSSEGGNLFAVSGSHSYTQTGSDTATITVTDVDGSTATATSTVAVGQVYAGIPSSFLASSFTDGNNSAPVTSFTVTINWGDGTPQVNGGVTGGNGSPYQVSGGGHTYTQDSIDQSGGVYTVTVTVKDSSGDQLSTSSTVQVVRPPLMLDTGNVETPPNSLTLSNVQVAAFTEPDTTDGTGEFSATIYWGDNSSSAGTVSGLGNGLFTVTGSHTYSSYPAAELSVVVSQGWLQQKPAAGKGDNLGGGAANQITFTPNIIKDKDTPSGMKPRIPPRKWEGPYEVTIGNGFKGQNLTLEVDFNNSQKDGMVWLDGGIQDGQQILTTALTLNGPGTYEYWIMAPSNRQTKPGNAGNISITVRKNGVGGPILKQTDGFSVDAIPDRVTETAWNPKAFEKNPLYGMQVKVTFHSDSGNPDDLKGHIGVIEKVAVESASGVWENDPPTFGAQEAYLPIEKSQGGADQVALKTQRIIQPILGNKTSDVKTSQAWIFQDSITDKKDLPIPESGFLRTFSVTKPDKGVVWQYLVSLTSSSTKGMKLGINVSAGITDPAAGITQTFAVQAVKVGGQNALVIKATN